jgi:hypothetical protein
MQMLQLNVVLLIDTLHPFDPKRESLESEHQLRTVCNVAVMVAFRHRHPASLARSVQAAVRCPDCSVKYILTSSDVSDFGLKLHKLLSIPQSSSAKPGDMTEDWSRRCREGFLLRPGDGLWPQFVAIDRASTLESVLQSLQRLLSLHVTCLKEGVYAVTSRAGLFHHPPNDPSVDYPVRLGWHPSPYTIVGSSTCTVSDFFPGSIYDRDFVYEPLPPLDSIDRVDQGCPEGAVWEAKRHLMQAFKSRQRIVEVRELRACEAFQRALRDLKLLDPSLGRDDPLVASLRQCLETDDRAMAQRIVANFPAEMPLAWRHCLLQELALVDWIFPSTAGTKPPNLNERRKLGRSYLRIADGEHLHCPWWSSKAPLIADEGVFVHEPFQQYTA